MTERKKNKADAPRYPGGESGAATRLVEAEAPPRAIGKGTKRTAAAAVAAAITALAGKKARARSGNLRTEPAREGARTGGETARRIGYSGTERVLQASHRVVANHLDTILIAFGKPSEVASILGVSPSQMTRWRGQQLPDGVNRDRIRRFADAVALLLQRYQPSAAADWFRAPSIDPRDGGGAPLDLVREGKWDTLRAYAEEAVSESYG
jgi:hypothetical protein